MKLYNESADYLEEGLQLIGYDVDLYAKYTSID